MNPPMLKPVIAPGKDDGSPAPSLRSVIRKSALLNVVIVLTSFPVLVYSGGPKAVVPILKIMAGISALIWTATFALFWLVTIPRILRTPVSTAKRSDALDSAEELGVADRWLDGPT